MVHQGVHFLVGGEFAVHELVEVFDEDLFEQFWIPDYEGWFVEDVDSEMRGFVGVVDFADSVEEVLFSGDYFVETAKDEDWFFEGDVFGLPVTIVFGEEVKEEDEKAT